MSENHRFSDVFRGYRNVTLDKKGLSAYYAEYKNGISGIHEIAK